MTASDCSRMVTILFDGIAYGMLLFVLAVRAGRDAGPDELHQPRARRLRHGGRLRHGAADGSLPACRSSPACRRPSSSPRALGLRAGAHALPAACTAGRTSTRCCSRSAWCSWPWRRSTISMGSSQQNIKLPAWLQGRCEIAAASHVGIYRSFIIVVCGALAVGLQSVPDAHALRQPPARRGRRPARGARASASTSTSVFAVDLRRRLGPGRPGRRARRRAAGARSRLPAEVHDLLPDRRRGRRHVGASPGRSLAALLLGIADVAGKYYVPELGAFIDLHRA